MESNETFWCAERMGADLAPCTVDATVGPYCKEHGQPHVKRHIRDSTGVRVRKVTLAHIKSYEAEWQRRGGHRGE